ncbi:YwqG family protein [Nocardioides bizhenqiangii]|uniref:YwqG family protein n=1 Tax=Nocardioides bizhenqiangii TaxID=3095076 RepID=A0ABZ0ZUC6_9ACTN|nr:YwqG family protein [Nocardioides sp. HM61]WQQ27922.1 YwqG family protein [Nocardioides sp. HM61]
MSGDRYDELMARRAALEGEVQRRFRAHRENALQDVPLLSQGRPTTAAARTRGIHLAADGSLHATLEFTDIHGVTSTVTMHATPGGEVEEIAAIEPEVAASGPHQAGDESEERLGIVTDLAREHLPEEAAQAFLALLRPALRLEHAGESDPVIAQLGGLPTLPVNSWPVWVGHGPLSHVLSFDCEPVSQLLPELGLPATGRLAFFYFDGTYDNYASTVFAGDPSSSPGFRVLHLHPEESSPAAITNAATPPPPGLRPFNPIALTAVRTVTWPSRETPTAEAVWTRAGLNGPRGGVSAAPVEALYAALWELPGGGYDTHQIGGHACPQQGPVELEVEQLRRGIAGEPFVWADPDVQSTASEWQLLLQVATDDEVDPDLMWGDVGQLYYLVRDIQRPQDALFTWQCG